jgi:hypothetical protein
MLKIALAGCQVNAEGAPPLDAGYNASGSG